MKSKELQDHAEKTAKLYDIKNGYIYSEITMRVFKAALLEDYEDYMTDRVSREPGKVFDRKAVIKEFLKQL